MTDVNSIYLLATELAPETFPVIDDDARTHGVSDQKYIVRKAALERAHQIRQFEIELYWKRASYFWILQAAVFAAIGFVWPSKDLDVPKILPLILASLGCITAVAGFLSAKGSKFWQENWEHHIDMLEDEFEGRLHKTAYVGKEGIVRSVSGINDRLAVCFVAFWIAIFVMAVLKFNPSLSSSMPANLIKKWTPGFQTLLVFFGTVIAVYFLWSRKTDFQNAKAISYRRLPAKLQHLDQIDETKLDKVQDLARLKKPFLIRREPKI